MTYYKLLIINGMGTKFLNLSTQMVVEPLNNDIFLDICFFLFILIVINYP